MKQFKFIIILILLLTNSSTFFSQKGVSYEIKKEENFAKEENIIKSCKVEDYIYILSSIRIVEAFSEEETFFLKKYTSDMKYIKQKVLPLEEGDYVKLIDGEDIAVYRRKKDRKMYNQYIAIDLQTLDLKEPEELLQGVSQKHENGYSVEISYVGELNFSVSKRNPKESYLKIVLFDENETELWTNKIMINKDEFFSDGRFNIDEEGNVYSIFRIYNFKKKKYELVNQKILRSGVKGVMKRVNLNDKFSADIISIEGGIRDGKNQDIIVCGEVYIKKGKKFGAFIISLDSYTFKENFSGFMPISSKVLSEGKPKKYKRSIDKFGLFNGANCSLNKLYFKPEGGYYLVFEAERTYVMDDGRSGELSGGVILMSLDKAGELIWQRIVPKQQMVSYTTGLVDVTGEILSKGAYHSLVNKSLYFVYNDNLLNINIENGLKNYRGSVPKKSALFLTKVDSYGVMTKSKLIDNSELEGFSLVSSPVKIADNKVIFFVKEKKTNTITKRIQVNIK